MKSSVQHTSILKVGNDTHQEVDLLAVEEPMEIRLTYGPVDGRQQSSISVTMRTPGHDFELALGFLFSEGIIQSYEDVISIRYCRGGDQSEKQEAAKENIVRVVLSPDTRLDLQRLQRNFYTTSSCGVCGKASIEALDTLCSPPRSDKFSVNVKAVHQAPAKLRAAQLVFNHTGGIHAAGLFDKDGKLLLWREDVGRHNALDKLLGTSLIGNKFPKDCFLLLSGRVSFELVQKALMGGIAMIAAVGAPSSLAVQLAHQYDITLIGFVRDQKFNIYSGSHRVALEEKTPTFT
ncbi:FdhD protein [Catalinimonas alkaloidigena]|uniref:formate dehydrogenase accessory sulfurtransferase FdhD n=1 Tax=Catalinimonas alkaloidigena TaxID=1075417 RepID=UPI002406ED6B|nr:formate dehydrogenase accessory sulfurtransferase FdhD [Catalinimonas alkaloidigena]MDF9801003.1 FdhD protein [Catalinimonas alkaloidigena]